MSEDEVEARAAYRAAWTRYQVPGLRPDERADLQQRMDSLQPRIAVGPRDPRWVEFAASLPGFLDFWKGLRKHLRTAIREEGEHGPTN